MEREVSDTEGIFSKRLSSNWAELPTTLRKKPKHRPEILSQFVDPSEISENESTRKIEPKPFNNVQRIVRRSEFLRKLETNENGKNVKLDGKRSSEYLFSRVDEDYRKHYDDHDSKLGPRRKSIGNLGDHRKFDHKNFSDEDRKTNSPDSLLVKSSESDLSSDEYGQTDDSGAFLEKASNREKGPKNEPRNRFVKFFAKDECRRKKKLGSVEDKKVSTESGHLDVNKNNVKQIHRGVESIKKDAKCQQKFEYENIPRIDVSKLDQKPYLNPIASTINSMINTTNCDRPAQPTIEQLRIEEGCLLRNSRNSSPLTLGPGSETKHRAQSPAKQSQNVTEGIPVNELIQDFYDSDQIAGKVNGERKVSKMETITEENADGSKLSVREILKRFEELRTQNETQMEEKSNDKTLTTIQETLKKLDEKVKSYQVTIPIKNSCPRLIYYLLRKSCS